MSLQELALQELCALAEGGEPSAASARAALFADDTGRNGCVVILASGVLKVYCKGRDGRILQIGAMDGVTAE